MLTRPKEGEPLREPVLSKREVLTLLFDEEPEQEQLEPQEEEADKKDKKDK